MANLGKVIYINEEDYSTLLNGGSITKSGTTYTYDSTALYVIKDVGAPEYAETAGYATSAGTATSATQDASGRNIVQTYATKASGATEIHYTDGNSNEHNVSVGDTLNQVITALDDAIGEFHVTVDSALSETSENAISNKAITQALYEDEEVISASLNDLNERMEEKQDLLVSGTNIKTVNGNSLLGSGNITIEAGGSGDVNVIETVKVNGTALTPDANKAVNVVVPTALSALSTDTTHQLVTSTEKSNWNSHTGNTEVHVTTANKNTWNGKQDALVSGTNIKTVNGNSILGNGNLSIQTGETNVIETVMVNGTALTVANKTVDVPVPVVDSGMSKTSENPVQNKVITQTIIDNELVTATALNDLNSRVDEKQDELVSGTNIKTVNNQSLLGSGNITVGGGDTNVIETVKVNGTALTPDANKAVNVAVPTALSALSDDNTHQLVTSTEKSNWNTHTGDTNIHVTTADKTNWNGKQAALVSGTNIKTVNGNTLLGGGDVTIATGQNNVIETVKVNGTGLTVTDKAVDIHVPTALSELQTDEQNQLVTSAEKNAWNTHTGNTEVHVTAADKTTWNGKVSKTGDTMTGKLTISSGGLGVTGSTTINGDIIATGQTKLYSSGNTLVVTGGTQINGSLTANTFSGNSITANTIVKQGGTSSQFLMANGSTIQKIALTQLPSVTTADNGKILMVVNGAWALVSPTTIYTGTGTPSSSQGNNGDIYLQTT